MLYMFDRLWWTLLIWLFIPCVWRGSCYYHQGRQSKRWDPPWFEFISTGCGRKLWRHQEIHRVIAAGQELRSDADDGITHKLFNLLTPNFRKRISWIIGLEFKNVWHLISNRSTVNDCCRHIVRQLKDRVDLIVPKSSNNAWLLGELIHTADLALYWRKTFFRPKGNYFFYGFLFSMTSRSQMMNKVILI